MAEPQARTPGTSLAVEHTPIPLPPAVAPARSGAPGETTFGARDRALASEIEHLELAPIHRAYLHERWLSQLSYFGSRARRAQQRYYALRLVALLGGVAIPSLVGLNISDRADATVGWLAFGLGLLVAAAVAVEEFFRFGERWRHFRKQGELLRGEGWAFLTRSGPSYRRYKSHDEAFPHFAANVEEILRHEVDGYIAEVARPPEGQWKQVAGPGTATPSPARAPKPKKPAPPAQ
jgi:hypothetical protein